jgi:DnaJ-class molecular chaperone
MKKPKRKDSLTEVECDACGGKGYPPVKEIAPGRRIYPAACKKCGGKGWVAKRPSLPSGPD